MWILWQWYLNMYGDSERHLQAELYRHLSADDNYKVWVEPKLYLQDSELHGKIPDLIITDEISKTILGVVEIKYSLDTGINSLGDITKLKLFSEQEGDIVLHVNAKGGRWDDVPKHRISPDVYLFYAVIGWDDMEAVNPDKLNPELKMNIPKNNFYHLYGKVNERENIFEIK